MYQQSLNFATLFTGNVNGNACLNGNSGNDNKYSDMSIGLGMDISIRGDGDNINNKEAMEINAESHWSHGGSLQFDITEKLDNNHEDSGQLKNNQEDSNLDNENDILSQTEIKHVEEVLIDPVDDVVVEDCCPEVCYRVCPCCIGDPDSPFWQLWYRHRLQVSRYKLTSTCTMISISLPLHTCNYRLIENKYFETVVLALILLSSAVMTLEDIWFETRPLLMDTLYYLDRILTVVFFLETDLKLFAMGCVMYFGNAWCWLDFVIVAVSLINFGASLLGAGNIPIFKTMRTLRALRPLRAMAKMEGMKVRSITFELLVDIFKAHYHCRSLSTP